MIRAYYRFYSYLFSASIFPFFGFKREDSLFSLGKRAVNYQNFLVSSRRLYDKIQDLEFDPQGIALNLSPFLV